MSLPLQDRLLFAFRLIFFFPLFLYQDLKSLFFGKKIDPKQSLTGKTILITGGNRGLGKQIVQDLIARDARVIIAVRDKQSAEEMYKEKNPSSRLVVHQVDLTSLNSVQELAKTILNSENQLDILIHNAAIVGPKEKTFTSDNIEITYQVNYVSPVLLTRSLLPLLKSTPKSRVIFLTSEMHLLPHKFDKDLIRQESSKYDALLNYSTSKLSQVAYAIKSGRELSEINGGVTFNCVHPGVLKTELVTSESGYFYRFSFIIMKLIRGISLERGSKGILYVAISPEIDSVNGKYFIAGHVHQPNKLCKNEQIQDEIQQFTDHLINQSLV